jgi:hypothetical protein
MTTTGNQTAPESELLTESNDGAENAGMRSVDEVIGMTQNAMPHDAPWLWRDRWAD